MGSLSYSQFVVVFGLVILLYSFLRTRILIIKRPFLFNAKWTTPIVAVGCGLLSLGDRSFPIMFDVIALLFISFLLICTQWQAYFVFGVSRESIREALEHAFKKLNVGYEETPGSLKLSSGGGEVFPMYLSMAGEGIICAKMQDKDLLRRIVAEINLYFKTQTVPMRTNNTMVIVFLVGMGLFFALGFLIYR